MNLVIDLGQSGSRFKFDTSREIVSLDIAKTSKETVLETFAELYMLMFFCYARHSLIIP